MHFADKMTLIVLEIFGFGKKKTLKMHLRRL